MTFEDRRDAGVQLAEALSPYAGKDVVVFALPRGGVVLGAEIAKRLKAPLDLVITKKVGHPGNPEYALCAVAEQGEPLCNEAELARVDPAWFAAELARVREEIRRRRETYFGGSRERPVEGKTVILEDDGVATGFTMKAAILDLRRRGAEKVIAAVPVAPEDTAEALSAMTDKLVALKIDRYFLGAVGAYYRTFRQVEDEEVLDLLREARAREAREV